MASDRRFKPIIGLFLSFVIILLWLPFPTSLVHADGKVEISVKPGIGGEYKVSQLVPILSQVHLCS